MAGTYKYIIDFIANNSKFVNAMSQNAGKAAEFEAKATKLVSTTNRLDQSVNSLSSRSDRLRGMLDGMVKSANPDRFNRLNAELVKTDKALEKAKGNIGKTVGGLGELAAAAGIAFSVAAVVEWGKESVRAYDEGAKSQTALLTALKGRSDVQERLITQAEDLMDKTLFDDDDTVRAQSMVAAFVKEEDKIKTLIPLIQDMASAKQMDLVSASDLVTKTLAGEMNALGRYGIKVEGAAGSAERLKMITEGLNNAFGGQAEAAAKVGTGSLTQLAMQYEDVQKAVGKLIISQENQAGSFTKTMAQNMKTISGFLNKINEYNDIGSDTTNSILTALLVKIGIVSQKSVDARIAMGKAAKELKSEMDDSVESYAPANINDKQFESIETLSEKLKKLQADLLLIDVTDKKSLDTQKQKISAAEAQIKSITDVAEASKYQAGSVGALGEEITKLNEQLANTNASDKASILTIGQKIQALELQKAAVTGLIAMEQVQGRVKAVSLDIKATKSKGPLAADIALNPKLNVGRTGLAGTFDKDAAQIEKANDRIQAAMDATQAKTEAVQGAMQQGFNKIGQSVVAGLGLASDGLDGFVSGMISTAIELISMFLAQSLAASIAGATTSGTATGPAAIFTTPAFIATAVGGVLAAFAAIPQFAAGGLAYGPTMGLMGEYPGAASNPEVIAPLSKLKGLIGGGGGSQEFILQPSIEYSYDGFRIRLNRVNKNVNKRT